MLASLRNRKSGRQVADNPPSLGWDDDDDFTRGATTVLRARELLRPFAALPSTNLTKIINGADSLGGQEAMGMLLRVANIPLEGGGKISAASFAQLVAEGSAALETLQNTMLNWTILQSLFLTIFVSLAVLNNGAPAYPLSANAHLVFVADPQAAASGAARGATSAAAWGDLASFAAPSDLEAQASIRRGLYVAECALIAAGLVACVVALMTANLCYGYIGAGLPDALSKVEFLMDTRSSGGNLWKIFDVVLLLLHLTVGFVTARSSAIMCMCIFAGFGCAQLVIFGVVIPCGPVAVGHLNLWRNANRVLRRAKSEAAADPAAPGGVSA